MNDSQAIGIMASILMARRHGFYDPTTAEIEIAVKAAKKTLQQASKSLQPKPEPTLREPSAAEQLASTFQKDD